MSNAPDVKNNLSESFNSELSPEPCTPKSRTDDPDYVPGLVEAGQQRDT